MTAARPDGNFTRASSPILARKYEKYRFQPFIARIIDAAGEAGETEVWLDFSNDVGYLESETHKELMDKYTAVCKMLFGMIDKVDKFCGAD